MEEKKEIVYLVLPYTFDPDESLELHVPLRQN